MWVRRRRRRRRVGRRGGQSKGLQREHRELDEAMTFLRNGGRGDRSGALARFGELLAAHIRWEERDLLEWLEQRLSSEALDRARDVFAARLPSTPVVCPTPQTL